jgi:ligand-binding SRPBCC domain-containing protein
MPVFENSFSVHAPLQAVADFHHATSALKRLTPPPVIVQLHRVDRLREGSISEFTLWIGPIPIRWTALHTGVDPLRGFTDTQVQGPFNQWVHTHTFSAEGDGQTRVTDHVEYIYPSGPRGLWVHLLFSPVSLRGMFAYRAWVTRRETEKHFKAYRTEEN